MKSVETKTQMTKAMKIINLIPEDYEGNPRDAMGYAWSKLVVSTDGKVDKKKSIPGEDLVGIFIGELFDKFERDEGPVAVSKIDQGNFCKGRTATGGMEVVIDDTLSAIVEIHCMWCGGGTYRVHTEFRPALPPKVEVAPIVEERGFGYCVKCGSYCFGDCEANE